MYLYWSDFSIVFAFNYVHVSRVTCHVSRVTYQQNVLLRSRTEDTLLDLTRGRTKVRRTDYHGRWQARTFTYWGSDAAYKHGGYVHEASKFGVICRSVSRSRYVWHGTGSRRCPLELDTVLLGQQIKWPKLYGGIHYGKGLWSRQSLHTPKASRLENCYNNSLTFLLYVQTSS
jgi:hypothetical protein